MDLTPLYPHSSPSSSLLSPNNQHVLTAFGTRLVLRSSSTLQITRSWKCEAKSTLSSKGVLKDTTSSRKPGSMGPPLAPASKANEAPPLSSLSFSPGSTHVLALVRAPNPVIYVFAVDKDDLVAKIEVGAEGVASGAGAVRWTPGGEGVMLRITVWPLTSSNPKPFQLPSPKSLHSHTLSPSPDQHYFALLTRHPSTSHDHISIYSTTVTPWTLLRSFSVAGRTEGEGIVDAKGVEWSPCGRFLAVWEGEVFGYRVSVFSPAGSLLGSYGPSPAPLTLPTSRPPSRQGSQAPRIAATPAADSGDQYAGLGVRCISWRPGGGSLAVGSWDGKVRILEEVRWGLGCELDLGERVGDSAAVFVEPSEWIPRTRGRGIVPFEATTTSRIPTPLKVDYNKPQPKIGIKDLSWSSDGSVLCCRHDGIPNAVFLFTFPSIYANQEPIPLLRPTKTTVIIFNSGIRNCVFHPHDNTLSMATGEGGIYAWFGGVDGKAEWVEGVGVPSSVPFVATKIEWSSAGDALLIADKSAFCLAFPVIEEDEGEGRREESVILERFGTAEGYGF